MGKKNTKQLSLLFLNNNNNTNINIHLKDLIDRLFEKTICLCLFTDSFDDIRIYLLLMYES